MKAKSSVSQPDKTSQFCFFLMNKFPDMLFNQKNTINDV